MLWEYRASPFPRRFLGFSWAVVGQTQSQRHPERLVLGLCAAFSLALIVTGTIDTLSPLAGLSLIILYWCIRPSLARIVSQLSTPVAKPLKQQHLLQGCYQLQ